MNDVTWYQMAPPHPDHENWEGYLRDPKGGAPIRLLAYTVAGGGAYAAQVEGSLTLNGVFPTIAEAWSDAVQTAQTQPWARTLRDTRISGEATKPRTPGLLFVCDEKQFLAHYDAMKASIAALAYQPAQQASMDDDLSTVVEAAWDKLTEDWVSQATAEG